MMLQDTFVAGSGVYATLIVNTASGNLFAQVLTDIEITAVNA